MMAADTSAADDPYWIGIAFSWYVAGIYISWTIQSLQYLYLYYIKWE
jgi:hypothetical protein